MICGFLYAFLQRHSPLLHELVVKPTEGVFFWYWRNNNTGVVIREGLVEPKEVGITSKDGEC